MDFHFEKISATLSGLTPDKPFRVTILAYTFGMSLLLNSNIFFIMIFRQIKVNHEEKNEKWVVTIVSLACY